MRQVNRKKDSYISWYLCPHKLPASFFFFTEVSPTFFYFIETFCRRQVNRKRYSFLSWWLWPQKPPASFFYNIEFLLFSSTLLELFVCVEVSDRQIATSVGGFGLTNRLLRYLNINEFLLLSSISLNFLSASRYPRENSYISWWI